MKHEHSSLKETLECAECVRFASPQATSDDTCPDGSWAGKLGTQTTRSEVYKRRNGVDWDAELEYVKELDAKRDAAQPAAGTTPSDIVRPAIEALSLDSLKDLRGQLDKRISEMECGPFTTSEPTPPQAERPRWCLMHREYKDICGCARAVAPVETPDAERAEWCCTGNGRGGHSDSCRYSKPEPDYGESKSPVPPAAQPAGGTGPLYTEQVMLPDAAAKHLGLTPAVETLPMTEIGSNSVTFNSETVPYGEAHRCPYCNGFHAGGCHKAPIAGKTIDNPVIPRAPETPQGAEQFVADWLKSKRYPDWIQGDTVFSIATKVAEAYATAQNAGLREEKAHERAMMNLELLNAQCESTRLREENERLKLPGKYAYHDIRCTIYTDGKCDCGQGELTELRAKLAEQEAKYTTLLHQRYEDMSEFRFRGKTAAELTKMLARYETAEAEAAALRERERWIPVEEKLPEKSDEYQIVEFNHALGELASVADFNLDDKAWYTLRGFGYDSEVRELHSVTHWKALSAAPERP